MAKNGLIEKIKSLKAKYPAQTEVVLYLLVGLLAKIVDMGVMAVVKYIAEPHLYANIIQLFLTTGTPRYDALATGAGFVVGTVAEFVLSSRFVFPKKQRGDTPFGFVVYCLISAGGLGIHVVSVYIGTRLWGLNPFLIKLVMGFVVVAYNYTVKKILLFSKGAAAKKAKKERQAKQAQAREEKGNLMESNKETGEV
jgi:putative flippase GtrA